MERATVDTKKGLDAATVAQAFVHTARLNPDRVALRTRGGEREISWAQYGEQVDRSRSACGNLARSGDVFALMLNNRPEFHIADAAAMSLGATPFALPDAHARPDRLPAERLRRRDRRHGTGVPGQRARGARAGALAVRHLILVDAPEGDDAIPSRTCWPRRATAPTSTASARRSSRMICSR